MNPHVGVARSNTHECITIGLPCEWLIKTCVWHAGHSLLPLDKDITETKFYIQTDSDSTAVMGLNSALRFKDNSINIHRIKSIEYGSIDHEPKDKGQNLNLDPDEYPDCDEF